LLQQPRLPLPDTLRFGVGIPDAFERWRDLYLHTALEKLVVFAAIALLLTILARFARRAIGEHIEDVNRRHVIRKWITYGYWILLLLVAVALFADWLTGLGTILAVLVAGVAFALQDVLKSVVGWFYISSRSGIGIGCRIQVGDNIGDVIDIGVLKTTMLEVGGPLVYGRQSTGRLLTIPNYQMVAEPVLIAPASSPYVWHEIQLAITFESDWRKAEQIMKEVGEDLHREAGSELERGFHKLESRYAFKYGTLTPIVYVSLGPSGTELTLRFLVHARRRRAAVDQASRRILDAIAADPSIRIAYQTVRVFRREEEAGVGQAPD
jgi:small-conductance mechanosensitive channel